jgi:hypothetical protein
MVIRNQAMVAARHARLNLDGSAQDMVSHHVGRNAMGLGSSYLRVTRELSAVRVIVKQSLMAASAVETLVVAKRLAGLD